MSEIDKAKENHESQCFKDAVELSKTIGGTTKSILRLISGDDVVREKKDSPDIIHICKRGQHAQKIVYVGIEHFRVDQTSKPKGTRRISISAANRSRVWDIYEKGHRELQGTNSISSAIGNTLLQLTGKMASDQAMFSIPDLLSDLKYNIGNHIINIGKYMANTQAYAQGASVELALLLEMHVPINDVVLYDGRRLKNYKKGQLVLLEEFIEVLEQIDKNMVDYLIILLYPNDFSPATDVVAFRTKDIRKSLKNQKRIIYANALNRRSFSQLKIGVVEDDNGQLVNEYNGVIDEQGMLEVFLQNLRVAYESKKNNIPYATNKMVQDFLVVAENCIIGFDDNNLPVFSADADFQDIQQKYLNCMDVPDDIASSFSINVEDV